MGVGALEREVPTDTWMIRRISQHKWQKGFAYGVIPPFDMRDSRNHP